jgi:hypothetical protein
MKKIILSLVISTCAIGAVIAQKDTKYERLYYKNLTVETKDVIIYVDDAVSTEAETNVSEKWVIIEPNESNFKIINLKGANYNGVKNYSFALEGLYKASASSKGIPTPDYKLPVAKNDFTTGNFNVSLNKLVKESDGTHLKLNITYIGDKVGLVFPSKVSVMMPNGKEYASVKKGLFQRKDPMVFKKGQTEAVTLNWDRMAGGSDMDMQKVDMNVKFNAMFTESDLEKLKGEKLSLEFDEDTSNAKRK